MAIIRECLGQLSWLLILTRFDTFGLCDQVASLWDDNCLPERADTFGQINGHNSGERVAIELVIYYG